MEFHNYFKCWIKKMLKLMEILGDVIMYGEQGDDRQYMIHFSHLVIRLCRVHNKLRHINWLHVVSRTILKKEKKCEGHIQHQIQHKSFQIRFRV